MATIEVRIVQVTHPVDNLFLWAPETARPYLHLEDKSKSLEQSSHHCLGDGSVDGEETLETDDEHHHICNLTR
ncbi:hypothetical protein NPIL_471781 [Nephila pilipes]|uniref:Uncharacterized protein n=1 Tax=Nephila pilipes TaxID=299642 RepID=A0A8X6PDD7_NEPPI|nr:hypothetical protein NPIL_471781 [Nephila pilipes]